MSRAALGYRRGDLALDVGERRRGGAAALAPASRAGAVAPARAASRPARKPRRLLSDAFSSRIAASNASTGIGRRPAAGDQAEHHRIDDRAALLRQLLHVEQQRLLRVLRDRLLEALGVVAAVAHLHLLDHEVGAAGRADQQGAVGRDEAAGDGAAGLHQLARHHQVDVADAGAQRQHRLAAAELAPGRRHDLDVIGGRAGALGDARDRGALRRQAVLGGRRDDPAGEHAAALAAERRDQDGDRTTCALRRHAAASWRAGPGRPLNQPMTVRRTRCSVRSHQCGLRISSAR